MASGHPEFDHPDELEFIPGSDRLGSEQPSFDTLAPDGPVRTRFEALLTQWKRADYASQSAARERTDELTRGWAAVHEISYLMKIQGALLENHAGNPEAIIEETVECIRITIDDSDIPQDWKLKQHELATQAEQVFHQEYREAS